MSFIRYLIITTIQIGVTRDLNAAYPLYMASDSGDKASEIFPLNLSVFSGVI